MALKSGRALPWSYRAGTGFLYRLPPALKLVFLVLLSVAAFAPAPVMAAGAFLVAAAAFSARRHPGELLAGSRPLVFTLILTGALRILGTDPGPPFRLYPRTEELPRILSFTGGILLSFAACSLFFSVTTMTEIRRTLERAELFVTSPFRRDKPRRGRLSLALALMFGFLPRFFERWEAASLALRARGAGKSFRGLRLALPLTVESLLEAAAETALAMEARGVEL